MSCSSFRLTERPRFEPLASTICSNHNTLAPITQIHSPSSSTHSLDIRGSFGYDQEHKYDLTWPNFATFEVWLQKEQDTNIIELVRKEVQHNSSTHNWITKHIYVCGRGYSGGTKPYQKKHERTRKVPVKKTGCPCRLTVKSYPGRDTILGYYKNEHSHEIGNSNARFTRLSKHTRDEVERLLRLGVDPKKILDQIQGQIYTEENLDNLETHEARRSQFITRADIRRIEKTIEEETVRLASQDGASIPLWIKNLRARGHFVVFKSSSDMPLPNSGLEANSFVLIIQTKYQQECWIKHASHYVGIDATHNTTHYENLSLFTLLVRDKWGHGMPAGWMISSNGIESSIYFFLKLIRSQNPDVIPENFMSDKDHAQMNAIRRAYPESALLLCWWHVLHAWQQHFVPTHFSELWKLLKGWIRIADQVEFNKCWARIQAIAPSSFTTYLKTYWIEDTKLWSGVFRQSRNIFQTCDTNMLVEAWHHLLKGNFMQGKRNRRLDHLIHILVDQAIPYFIHRHRRQEFGFEGPDLEVQKRIEIESRSYDIQLASISHAPQEGAQVFFVQSQSRTGVQYRVDLDSYDCECVSFPTICFCKHICAVQRNFPEECHLVPTSSLAIHCEDSFASSSQKFNPDSTHSGVSNTSVKDSCNTQSIILNQLSKLVIHLQSQSSNNLPTSLLAFKDPLDVILEEIGSSDHTLLPQKKKVGPNQHSWTETAAVMNVPVKSKRKTHIDPYGGGERPGKRAKPDARLPQTQTRSQLPAPVPLVSATGIVATPPTSIPHRLTEIPKAPAPVLEGPFHVPIPPPPTQLNPQTFPLENFDFSALYRLKRAQLNQLCAFHGIKANGTNEAVITCLLEYQSSL